MYVCNFSSYQVCKPAECSLINYYTGQVVWTGSSSMQINMEVKVVSDPQPWVTAAFTFVARSPQTGKATAVNRLNPETEEEKALFQEVEQKNQRRKAKRKAAAGGAGAAEGGRHKRGHHHASSSGATFDKAAITQVLLQQARPLLEMPCLADPTCLLVDTTR